MIETPSYQDYLPGSHCSFCGTKFAEQDSYPRPCYHCGNVAYKNPVPVVVGIIPVHTRLYHSHCGWLIQQRNIDPGKGGWALTSGYINYRETWQQALVRELQEEVGLITRPEDYHLVEVVNAANHNMLIFGAHNYGVYSKEVHFSPNPEVSAIGFPMSPKYQELVFPVHNEVWQRYYNSLDDVGEP